MPKAWSAKRERQYEHVKQGYERQGKPEPVAEEIAARTVNKERAQHGEAREASAPSLRDMPAPQRGGQRSHAGAQGRTRDQLLRMGCAAQKAEVRRTLQLGVAG